MTAHRADDGVELDQLHAAEIEPVLVRLIDRADRIVAKRRARILDMRAEHVRDRMVRDEIVEAIDAVRERRRIAHVEPAGIERVAREEDPGAAIVHCDARRLVAWNRKDVQYAPAQVDRSTVGGPMRDAEESAHRSCVAADENGIGTVNELRVAGDVIAVRMAVRDDQ